MLVLRLSILSRSICGLSYFPDGLCADGMGNLKKFILQSRHQNKNIGKRNIYGVGQLCRGTLLDIAFLNKLGSRGSRSQFTRIGVPRALDSCLSFCLSKWGAATERISRST